MLALNTDRKDEAKGIMKQLSGSQSLPEHLSHWMHHQMYAALDSQRRASDMLAAICSDTDNALKKARKQNLAGSLLEYHDHKSSLARANLKSSRLQTAIAVIIAVVAISLVIYISYRRHLRQQSIVEEYMTMVKELEHLLSQQAAPALETASAADSDTDETNRASLVLLKKHFDEFDILCKNFSRDATNDSRKTIAECVTKMIDIFISDKNRLQELERFADCQYDDIMKNLRIDFPKLKEEDYTLFLFSRLGFSTATIALLMKKENNKTAIYNRRKRLKERFRLFDGENRHRYLEVMGE